MGKQLPAEVTEVLQHFDCDHLPEHLQAVALPIRTMAHDLAGRLEGPQLLQGLRRLLEAKDCFVRAALPATESRPAWTTETGITFEPPPA